MKLKIADIKLNPDNPRQIKDDKYKKLVTSLKDFPEMADVREIVVNKDHMILGGNMRFKAMKDAGWEEVPVKVVDWAEDKQKEFVIKDNASFGEWDWDSIANQYELEDLDAWGVDLPQYLAEDQEVEEDEAPEVSKEDPKSKLGEVYQLGRHRLMCGDSASPEDLKRLMGGVTADMLHTDPPYGVKYDEVVQSRANQKKGKDWGKIYKDELVDEKYQEWLTDIFINLKEVIKPDAPWYVWFGQQQQVYVQAALKESANVLTHRLIIWVKPSLVFGRGHYHWRHEACIYGWQKGNMPKTKPPATETTVWELNANLGNKHEHPTQKPNALAARAIGNSSNENEVILDVFGGGGSTLLASEQLNRTAYLMEIAPEFCDVIRKRYWKFTHDNNEEGWEDGTPAIN